MIRSPKQVTSPNTVKHRSKHWGYIRKDEAELHNRQSDKECVRNGSQYTEEANYNRKQVYVAERRRRAIGVGDCSWERVGVAENR